MGPGTSTGKKSRRDRRQVCGSSIGVAFDPQKCARRMPFSNPHTSSRGGYRGLEMTGASRQVSRCSIVVTFDTHNLGTDVLEERPRNCVGSGSAVIKALRSGPGTLTLCFDTAPPCVHSKGAWNEGWHTDRWRLWLESQVACCIHGCCQLKQIGFGAQQPLLSDVPGTALDCSRVGCKRSLICNVRTAK